MDLIFLSMIVVSVTGPVEADPEYQLIVEANNITVEIDNEISRFSCLLKLNSSNASWASVTFCQIFY